MFKYLLIPYLPTPYTRDFIFFKFKNWKSYFRDFSFIWTVKKNSSAKLSLFFGGSIPSGFMENIFHRNIIFKICKIIIHCLKNDVNKNLNFNGLVKQIHRYMAMSYLPDSCIIDIIFNYSCSLKSKILWL